ncbi:MAG: 3'(2'),5'-bisphosphate nucleotidase [Candidatus Hydrogenedentota bacterium]
MKDAQHPEVQFAVNAVRRAAMLGQRVKQGMALMNLTKRDFSPVTVGDFAIQAYVAHALSKALPTDKLVGEETADDLCKTEEAEMLRVVVEFVEKAVPGATAEQVCAWIDQGSAEATGRFWTLDPIDGTKGYVRGGQYAVALALVEDGQVQLGVLGCPNLDPSCSPEILADGALLVAKRGAGTWVTPMQESEAPWQPLEVSPCADTTQARMLRSFEASHTDAGAVDAIAAKLGIAVEPVRMDSQAKYAVLASGGAELLLRLLSPKQPDYKEKIWDQAAGSIILEEAGGKITDLKGRPLDFSTGRQLVHNTGVFASNGTLHAAGLEAIAAVCDLPG